MLQSLASGCRARTSHYYMLYLLAALHSAHAAVVVVVLFAICSASLETICLLLHKLIDNDANMQWLLCVHCNESSPAEFKI